MNQKHPSASCFMFCEVTWQTTTGSDEPKKYLDITVISYGLYGQCI
jgi:hypothetical protein